MPSAMMRAMVSVDPPGASGTRMVTGRDGKDCAFAPPIAQPAASAMAIIVFIICVLPDVGYTVAPRIRPGLGGFDPPRPCLNANPPGTGLTTHDITSRSLESRPIDTRAAETRSIETRTSWV